VRGTVGQFPSETCSFGRSASASVVVGVILGGVVVVGVVNNEVVDDGVVLVRRRCGCRRCCRRG
jgi:uncharacterized protein (DUF849 family)